MEKKNEIKRINYLLLIIQLLNHAQYVYCILPIKKTSHNYFTTNLFEMIIHF